MDVGISGEAVAAMYDMESRWARAVDEMTFFGIPVKDLPRERLLMLVGMLSCESRRHREESRRILQMYGAK